MIMPLLWFPILIWLGLEDMYFVALLWSIVCAATQGLLFKLEKFLSTHTIEEWSEILITPVESMIHYRMFIATKRENL